MMIIGVAINIAQESHTQQVMFLYTDKKGRTWTYSVSSRIGVTMKSKAIFVTNVGKLEISSKLEIDGTCE